MSNLKGIDWNQKDMCLGIGRPDLLPFFEQDIFGLNGEEHSLALEQLVNERIAEIKQEFTPLKVNGELEKITKLDRPNWFMASSEVDVLSDAQYMELLNNQFEMEKDND